MDAAETNASFFPPPPPRYALFTDRNLELARLIISSSPSSADQAQHGALLAAGASEDEAKALDGIDVRGLVEPPRMDWVQESGGWTAFGESEPWPGEEAKPALEGMPKLYDEGMERKEALHALLQTLLHSYLALLSTLTNIGPPSLNPGATPAPRTGSSPPADPGAVMAHIELVAFNMHGLCNELRPQQARETLKVMAKEMAKDRRAKAKEVKDTCAELKEKLASLRATLQDFTTPSAALDSLDEPEQEATLAAMELPASDHSEAPHQTAALIENGEAG